MINFKNMVKVLLLALFVCVWSSAALAENKGNIVYGDTSNNINTTDPSKPNYMPYATSLITYVEKGEPTKTETPQEAVKSTGAGGGTTNANFCTTDFGIFSDLLNTGTLIFKRLRDLIYVVAGFGIIAVAVGGFFGNLNWKWLGAIVISLVVIATAGELIVLMTGCTSYDAKLITNTLSNASAMRTLSTEEYNKLYTEEVKTDGAAKAKLDNWWDGYDVQSPPSAGQSAAPVADSAAGDKAATAEKTEAGGEKPAAAAEGNS